MKRVVIALVCAACGGKSVGKEIEKLNGASSLAEKTETVCWLADHLTDNEAESAISEYTRKLLTTRQTDKAAAQAQIDCIAKRASTSMYGFSENVVRASLKYPSPAMQESLKQIDEQWQRKQITQYLQDLASREEDVADAPQVVAGLVEAMDRANIVKTWVSGSVLLLWARTGNPALKARIDGAKHEELNDAFTYAVDFLENGYNADKKVVVEKLFADFNARGIKFYQDGACKLVPDATGCDEVKKRRAEASAKADANTSPLVAILEPVRRAAGAAAAKKTTGPTSDAERWKAELDKAAPSPVHDEIVEVPEMNEAMQKIVALGQPIQQDCRTVMGFGGTDGLTCAKALGKMKLQVLIDATLWHLEHYNGAYAKERKKAYGEGKGVVVGLRALMDYTDKSAEEVFLKSLSAFDPELVKFVIAKVKERQKVGPAVDGLFQFMARKEKFFVTEIDNYVGLLTSYGAEVTPAVVKNLERELVKAKQPEKVFWAHKIVALRALQQVGTKAALPVLDKYGSDRSGYADQKVDADGTVVSSTDVPFADAIAATKKAIAPR